MPVGRDLLVRVQAISVNPIDTKVRQGAYKQGCEPKVLGWDAAGTVVSVGPEAALFKPGDAVFYAGALDRPVATPRSSAWTSASSVPSQPASISPPPRRYRLPR